MGALSDFWKQVDALAEKQRLAIPVWCVWDARDPDAGYALYRRQTADEAKAEFARDLPEGYPADIACRPATGEQIKEQQDSEARWGRPPGLVSLRRHMERI